MIKKVFGHSKSKNTTLLLFLEDLRREDVKESTSESTFYFYSLVINKWKAKLTVKMPSDTNIDQGLLGTPEIKKEYFHFQIFILPSRLCLLYLLLW